MSVELILTIIGLGIAGLMLPRPGGFAVVALAVVAFVFHLFGFMR